MIFGLVQENSMGNLLHTNGVVKLVLILSNLRRSHDTIGALVHGGRDVQVTNHEESDRSTGETTQRRQDSKLRRAKRLGTNVTKMRADNEQLLNDRFPE